MTTLSHVPELPAPKRQVTSTFSLTESGSNFARVWCTVAPTGSELDGKLNSSTDPLNRFPVFEGASGATWSHTFDKGGKYTFVAQEYLKGSGYGGGYEGDPNNSTNEEKVGSEATLTLYIGQRVTQPIGPPGNQATLVLWVWNDRIQATTKAFYGEDSPSIAAQSPTPIVRTAIESTTVKAALANLVGADLTDSLTIGDMTSWTHSLWSAFNQHLQGSGLHDTDDTYNFIRDSFDPTPDQKSYQDFVKEALRLLKQHVTNDTGQADPISGLSGPDTGEFHMAGGLHLSDRAKIPLYENVSSFGEAYGALVDLYRCYDAHQRNDSVHDASNSFGLIAYTLVMLVHKAFLAVIASAVPTTPPAQSTGVQLLISSAGFKEA